MIPLPLRSTADAVMLAVFDLAPFLGADHPSADATPADAIRHYGLVDGRPAPQFHLWRAWRAVVRHTDEWQPFLAAEMPAVRLAVLV